MKKKTVGLITSHNGINFGTALQTFATYAAVERAGYSCTLIDYMYPTKYHLTKAKRDENKTKSFIFEKSQLFNYLLLAFKRTLLRISGIKRKQNRKFSDFINRIPKTKPFNMLSIVKDPPSFDIFLTGSDQCWNPRYMHHDLSMLLNFVPDETPKLAYAASFGSSEIAPEFHEEYRKYLLRYDFLSVREKSGCPLIKNLTGRKDTKYVLDPTFLLKKDEWLELISAKPFLEEGKFILCYILNYVFEPYPALTDMIAEVRKTYDLPLVFIGKNRYPQDAGDTTVLDAGPEDFLNLMAGAAFVITNSFHGTAFSINFRKDFLAVLNPNASLDDRVSNILAATGMQARGVVLGNSVKEVIKNKTCYSAQNETTIESLRNESLSFLSDSLKKCAGKK